MLAILVKHCKLRVHVQYFGSVGYVGFAVSTRENRNGFLKGTKVRRPFLVYSDK
jgi:hypothetical protein